MNKSMSLTDRRGMQIDRSRLLDGFVSGHRFRTEICHSAVEQCGNPCLAKQTTNIPEVREISTTRLDFSVSYKIT